MSGGMEGAPPPPPSPPSTPPVPADDASSTFTSSSASEPSADPSAPYTLTLDDIEASIIATQDRFLLEKAADQQLTDCTYAQGAISQPIYSCITCTRTAEDGSVQYVALCGSCALRCHGDHDVEELYDKRDVRCDCPTLLSRPSLTPSSSLASLPSPPSPPFPCCALNPADVPYPLNACNTYSHNYAARYCRCDGEHNPDVDVMFQCDLCQDWFHERCITTPQPTPGEDDLFLCSACLGDPRYDFLVPYFVHAQTQVDDSKEDTAAAEVDLFPEVSKRKEEQGMVGYEEVRREEKVQAYPVEVREDRQAGWVCVYCSYFNRPQEGECFGCEKEKKEDLTHSTLLKPFITSPSSHPSSTSTPSSASQSSSSTSDTSGPDHPTPCTRLTIVPVCFPLAHPHDLWLSSAWSSTLCTCPDCLSLYSSRAPFLLPHLTPGTPPSSPPQPTSSSLVSSYLASLPRAAVLNGLSAIADWNEVVMAGLGRLTAEVEGGGGDRVVTKEMVEEVVREAREECVRRRRKRMEEEEAEEGDADAMKRPRFEE